jgi:2-keto-3-deoxy-L-rhamnonate aldolase RhmA
MDQWTSPVRARLQAGEPVVALTLTTPDVEAAAYASRLGFHLLWVEMEHSPITLETLRLMVLATRGRPAQVFARVPVNELWTAKRALDQGVSGVIFPFTSNAALAAQASAATHYPPVGRRGSGAGLATLTWPPSESYYDSADSQVVTVCVVEEARALEQIDEIAATPGIDVIFIGVSDLSFSLGLRGRQGSPEHNTAIAKIRDAALRHGKAVGRPAATAARMVEYRKEGFLFFQTVTNLGLMAAGARGILEPLGIQPVKEDERALY